MAGRYGLLSMAAKQHRVHLRRLRRLRDESLRLRSFAVVMGLVDGLDYSPAASAFFLAALGRTLRPHAGIVEALAGRECLIELDKCALVRPSHSPPPAHPRAAGARSERPGPSSGLRGTLVRAAHPARTGLPRIRR